MEQGKHEAVETESAVHDHFLNNNVYNKLKFVAQILLPAVGTLYFALAAIWKLPSAEEVIGSITAVDAFLGVLLSASTSSFNKSEAKYDGDVNVIETDDKKSFQLALKDDIDLYDLDKKKELVFKVNAP